MAVQGGRAARGATGRPARPGGAGKPPSQRKARLVRLGDVCAIVQGQSPPSPSCTGDPESGLPFYQGKAEFGRMYPTPNRWCSEPVKVAIKNDILVSVRAPVGDVNICPGRCCIGRGIMAVRAQEGVDHMYVFYYLRYIQGRIRRLGSGTTFMSITGEQLRGVKISMPGLERQRRIASILSNVDAVMGNAENIMQAWEKLRLGLTQNLFLDGDVNAPSSQTWKQATLSSIARICPSLPRNSRPDPLTNVSYVPMSSIEENTGKIALEFTKKFKNTRGYTYFQNNDILFAKITPSMENGKIAIAGNLVNGVGFATTEVYVIRFNALKYDPVFYLYYFLQPSFRACARRTMSGSAGQLRVPSSFIKNVKVPIPPIPEQRRIASILSGVDAVLENHRLYQKRLERLKKGLMQKLLTR